MLASTRKKNALCIHSINERVAVENKASVLCRVVPTNLRLITLCPLRSPYVCRTRHQYAPEHLHTTQEADTGYREVVMFWRCGGGGRKDKTRKDFVSAVAGLSFAHAMRTSLFLHLFSSRGALLPGLLISLSRRSFDCYAGV